MFKLLIFGVGAALGAGGAGGWLLSERSSRQQPRNLQGALGQRLQDLNVRFAESKAEGERAGRETEERLRLRLAALRRQPDSRSGA